MTTGARDEARLSASSEPRVIDTLLGILDAVDAPGLDVFLHELDAEQEEQVRSWYAKNHKDAVRHLTTSNELRNDPELDRHYAALWMQAVLAIGLSSPAAAVARVPWRDLWDYQVERQPAAATAVHLLWEKDIEWVRSFVTKAASLRLGVEDARNSIDTLYWILQAAVVHHDLPCPAGTTFLEGWVATRPWRQADAGGWRYEAVPLVDVLPADPLVPDVVYHVLGSGHVGKLGTLPEAAASLSATGELDRGRLLRISLETLTRQQNVSSQRVLAKLLVALEITGDDVPGGLTFLLGMIATCNGSVGVALLPLACSMVSDGEELRELSGIIAGRQERKQKTALVRFLGSKELRDRVGREAVLEALSAFDDAEDASLERAVTKVRLSLGSSTSATSPQVTYGLWNMAVQVPERGKYEEHFYQYLRTPVGFTAALYASDDGLWRLAVRSTLKSVHDGKAVGPALEPRLQASLTTGDLSLTRLSRSLEQLFLAGGMAQFWPVAVRLAAQASAQARRPTGLDELLRTLVRYAAEVPDLVVPDAIRTLAAESRSTKAGHEARALVAAAPVHGRQQPVPADSPTRPPSTGLWKDFPPAFLERLPSEGIPAERPTSMLARSEADGPAHLLGTPPLERSWPPLMLAAMVRSTSDNGVEGMRREVAQWRDALSAAHANYAGHLQATGAALMLWADGGLTPQTYWHLVRNARTYRQGWEELRDRSGDVTGNVSLPEPNLVDEVRLPTPTLPGALTAPPERMQFLLACEGLLRAGTTRQLLSTPSYADGTLDFDDLLARIDEGDGTPVGPLDLLQAMMRLRPAAPARLNELDDRTLTLAPDLYAPEAPSEPVDAMPHLRRWVAEGGAPMLEVSIDHEGGTWVVQPLPVDLSEFAAVPSGLFEFDAAPRYQMGTLWRTFPRWPDVIWLGYGRRPFHLQPYDHGDAAREVARVPGHFGLAAHGCLVTTFMSDLTKTRKLALALTLGAARGGWLDHERLATVFIEYLDRGVLDLARLAGSLDGLMTGGAISVAWPAALDLAEHAARQEPLPRGLSGLLRVLATYGHEVPEPRAPASIRALADASKASAARREARALLVSMGLTT